MSTNIRHPVRGKPAFSLSEMTAVIAVLLILLASGVGLLHGTGTRSSRTGADLLAGVIERARTAAIASRSYVVLVVAEPGDLPAGDERCRLGLFRVDNWPTSPAEPVTGVLIDRWRTLESGTVLIGGEVAGLANPLDAAELTISYGTSKPQTVTAHCVAFNPRGGLHYPAGSTPVVMRIAQGGYQGGKAMVNRRGGAGAITESSLKIGRVIARPYRTDG